MSRPATAGPASRFSCQIAPPTATALGISPFGTICGSKAIRLGRSKALMHPDKKANVITCHNAIHPAITRVASDHESGENEEDGSRTKLGENHYASSVGAIGN